MKVRIGTRGSDLALWQAHHVADRLAPDVEVDIIVIKTRGDAIDTQPLSKVEGKAFFTAEIERALLAGEVDLAVHSHKDLETECDPGLKVVAVPERGPVEERLLVRAEAHDPHAPLLPVVLGAKLGTSAPRRQSQLLALRPDITMAELRGNVPTRVRRLAEGRYDGVLIAAAGLHRLGLDTTGLVSVLLPPELLVPAPAQGALALQIRAGDDELERVLVERLHDPATAEQVAAERWLLRQSGGGCHVPLGALVQRLDDETAADATSVEPGEVGSGAHRARLFLGADHPREGDLARWIVARGATPQQAAETAWALVDIGEPTGAGPLAGLHVVLVGSADGGSATTERLLSLGASVRQETVLAFRGVKAPGLPAQLARLKPGDMLAVTSQEAARRLSGQRVPPGVKVAAVGPGTARALSASGLRPDVVGKGGSRALARLIDVPDGGTVLFPCAKDARPELPDGLRERGVSVERVVLYQTVASPRSQVVDGADVVLYMSPSAVSIAVSQGHEARRGKVVRIGLGGSTCDALQDEDLNHERPAGSGPESAIALICQLFDPTRRQGAQASSSG